MSPAVTSDPIDVWTVRFDRQVFFIRSSASTRESTASQQYPASLALSARASRTDFWVGDICSGAQIP